MKHSSPLLLSLLFVAAVSPLHAQVAQTAAPAEQADTLSDQATTAPKQVDLRSATVSAKRKGLFHALGLTQNNETITGHELLRAACCNLGESFVNNPSVDVNYSDAATGAPTPHKIPFNPTRRTRAYAYIRARALSEFAIFAFTLHLTPQQTVYQPVEGEGKPCIHLHLHRNKLIFNTLHHTDCKKQVKAKG